MRLLPYFALRLLLVIPIAWGVVTLTFVVSRVLAADPVELFLPPQADEAIRRQVRADLGLDQPLATQYARYLRGLARGDLGRSIATGRPVAADLADRLPATLELSVFALVVAVGVGLPLALAAAVRRGGPLDAAVRLVQLVGLAAPAFWLGLALIAVFSVRLGWLPGPAGRLAIGAEPPARLTGLYVVDALLAGQPALAGAAAAHLLLPGLTLALGTLAPIARIARTALIEALAAEHVRAGRAFGVRRRALYLQHGLRNALAPILATVAGSVGFLLAGAVLVESVFNWPGMGQYALGAIRLSDYAALQGFVIWSAIAYAVAFAVADVLTAAADPRAR